MTAPPVNLLKLREAAALLATSPRTVSRLIASGSLPGVAKVGREYRLRADKLAAWIDAGGSASR